MKNVAVLGASPKEDRYAFKAQKWLMESGYNVFPVNPAYEEIASVKVFSSVSEIEEPLHTLSVYLNPDRLAGYAEQIIQKKPTRIIMNPGAENAELKAKFEENGIRVQEACTLVLLRTGQFEK